MSKGIKMRSALGRHGNSYTIDALQALHDGHQTIPDLICDHPGCGSAVRFVPRYQQNRANRIEPVDVPAYIGLTSNSEHIAGCRYNAAGRIMVIVAQSDPDFLKALDDGKRELRLLTLHNGLEGRSLSGSALTHGGKPAAASTAGKATMSFSQSEEKLTSYLRTTADLVALRAACESDAFLSAELCLRFGTKRIAWSQFFFEQGRYDEAWELVKTSIANAYPIALAGVVKVHHTPVPGAKYKSSYLNCKPLYKRTNDPDRLDSFEVTIAHLDGKWLASFPVDKFAEAVEIQRKNPRDPTRTTTFITHKLTLLPKFKRQIVKVE